jgi:DNA-binding CsgD family transcriptional regulator
MGILLAQRLRHKSEAEFLNAHFYFLIFMLTFGAYGLWGQVLIRGLISSLVEAQVADRISGIITFIGLPFLIISWYMLIKMAKEMSGTTVRKWYLPFFVALNSFAIILFGLLIHYYREFQAMEVVRYYFMIFNTLYFIVAVFILLFSSNGKKLLRFNRVHIAVGLGLIAFAQGIILYFYRDNVWMAIVFIFVFFGAQLFLPVYISYFTDFRPFKVIAQTSSSFGIFCKKFEISPRESEIILQLCKGLTNKDIADKLFISTQTVKDHTHRIYLKTMVRNRTELANLVQKETEK